MAQELKAYNVICTDDISEDYDVDALGAVDFEAYNCDDVDEHIRKMEAEKDAENRRLKRALWIARANRASAWQIHFSLSHNHSIKREFTINGASSPHEGMVTMRTARDWAMIWKNVERKCRAKAEEYK